jgi:hypothetical protein
VLAGNMKVTTAVALKEDYFLILVGFSKHELEDKHGQNNYPRVKNPSV